MKKPTKVQVFEAVRDTIQDMEDWLQLPKPGEEVSEGGSHFITEWAEFKRKTLLKYFKS